jgi:hypothetical protein
MCNIYKTGYIICSKEGLRRGPNKNIRCVDEEHVPCDHGPCPKPAVRYEWVKYKCPEHGGPSHAERAKLIREGRKKGRKAGVEVWEAKKTRPSRWHNAVCTMI